MSKLRFSASAFPMLAACLVVPLITLGRCAYAQVYYTPEEVRVAGLPTLMARTHDPSNVLATSLDTIIHDRDICCGKDSALEDSVERADPASLKDIAARLQGRHLLSDGRPILVTANYLDATAVDAEMLITTLQAKQPLLTQWNGHLYVCYGVIYRKDYDASNGTELYTLLKMLLLDTRYADSHREAVFDRATDDASKIQGMLRVLVAPQ
jgi:hypothetical protein